MESQEVNARWGMPKEGRWAYGLCGSITLLLLVDSWVLGGGWWVESEETRRLVEFARVSVLAFSLVSLMKRFMLAWVSLVCILALLLSYELSVINTFALSAWLGLALSTLVPLMALWWVRPVRS